MDLTGRLDPEVAAAFPHLPVLDLTDIPTARTTMMDMLAAANADAPPNPDVVRQDYFVPGLDGAPDVRSGTTGRSTSPACCPACTGFTAAATCSARSSRTTR
jgi:hypothetical protein